MRVGVCVRVCACADVGVWVSWLGRTNWKFQELLLFQSCPPETSTVTQSYFSSEELSQTKKRYFSKSPSFH